MPAGVPGASSLYAPISRVFLMPFWCISGKFLVLSDALYAAKTFLDPLQTQARCLVTAFLSTPLPLPGATTKKPNITKQYYKDTLDLQKSDANCCSL